MVLKVTKAICMKTQINTRTKFSKGKEKWKMVKCGQFLIFLCKGEADTAWRR